VTQSTGGGFPWGFTILMVLAALLYLLMTANILGARSSDAAGNGMAQAFCAILSVLVWILLSIALLIARSHGAVPGWAMACLVVLVPLAALSVTVAIMFWGEKGGWLVVLPVGAPLLTALFAFWARLPSLHGLLPVDLANAAIVAVLALATALPFASLAF
jgi:hypothetical protein